MADRQVAADTKSGADTNVRHMVGPDNGGEPQHRHAGRLLRHVARMLDEIADHAGQRGVLLTFDDFVAGTEDFGEPHPAADGDAPQHANPEPACSMRSRDPDLRPCSRERSPAVTGGAARADADRARSRRR